MANSIRLTDKREILVGINDWPAYVRQYMRLHGQSIELYRKIAPMLDMMSERYNLCYHTHHDNFIQPDVLVLMKDEYRKDKEDVFLIVFHKPPITWTETNVIFSIKFVFYDGNIAVKHTQFRSYFDYIDYFELTKVFFDNLPNLHSLAPKISAVIENKITADDLIHLDLTNIDHIIFDAELSPKFRAHLRLLNPGLSTSRTTDLFIDLKGKVNLSTLKIYSCTKLLPEAENT